jgi:hypothetical protein
MPSEEKAKRKNDSLDYWTMAILAVIAMITLFLFVLFLSIYLPNPQLVPITAVP